MEAIQTAVSSGKLQDIAAKNLISNPYQPRIKSNDSPKELDELWYSIESVGLQHRPRVRPSPISEGKFEIFDGHRRVACIMLKSNWPTIPCEVYENLDDRTMVRMMYAVDHHKALEPLEMGNFLKKTRALYKDDKEQMKEFDNMPSSSYYDRLKLGGAIQVALDISARQKVDFSEFRDAIKGSRELITTFAEITDMGDSDANLQAYEIVRSGKEKALVELPKLLESLKTKLAEPEIQGKKATQELAENLAKEKDPVKQAQIIKEHLDKNTPVGKPFTCSCGKTYYLNLDKPNLVVLRSVAMKDAPFTF